MKMLSNGRGSVRIQDGIAEGWSGGSLIGALPIPMSRADAEMMVRLCTDPELKHDDLGRTAEIFIERDMVAPPPETPSETT